MNQATPMIEVLILSAAATASSLGFLASMTLYCFAKFKVRPNRQALRCLYQYAALFFAGASLLCVNWMMGDRGPLPMRPAMDAQARVGFAAVLCVWMLMVLSTFMAHRVIRVVTRSHSTPEGRNLHQARRLFDQGRLVGGRRLASMGGRRRRGRAATA